MFVNVSSPYGKSLLNKGAGHRKYARFITIAAHHKGTKSRNRELFFLTRIAITFRSRLKLNLFFEGQPLQERKMAPNRVSWLNSREQQIRSKSSR